jgi:ATP-dependent DNA helicase RecG
VKKTSENLPDELIKRLHFHSRFSSLRQIHFPANELLAEEAKNRFRFEELFLSQLRILQVKVGRKKTLNGFVFTQLGNFFKSFYHEKLPFQLTNAQKRVSRKLSTI